MGHYRIWRELRKLRRDIKRLRFMLTRPRSIRLLVTGEHDMAIKFAVVLPLPPMNPADWAEIASGELTVQVGDGDVLTISTDKAVQESEPRQIADERFVGAQGTPVDLSFSYIDDAGNKSLAVTTSQILRDTVPPVAPDSIGLVETEETPDV